MCALSEPRWPIDRTHEYLCREDYSTSRGGFHSFAQLPERIRIDQLLSANHQETSSHGQVIYLAFKSFKTNWKILLFIIFRIEIFLLDLQTEEVSKRTYAPTDYLQINQREILFGEKSHLIVFNESSDAIITFKTDLWFNKRGFLLFYRGKKTLFNPNNRHLFKLNDF